MFKNSFPTAFLSTFALFENSRKTQIKTTVLEEFQINIFGVFSLFGAFQGLILFLIFAFHKSFSKKSNWILSMLLLTLSVANFWGAMEEIQIYETYPVLRFLPLIWTGLIPPLTYLFIKFLTNPKYKIRRLEYLLFLPFILDLLLKFVGLYAFQTGNLDLETDLGLYYTIRKFIEISEAILGVSVLVISIKTLRTYEHELYGNYSDISDKSLKWLIQLLFGGCLLAVFWLMNAMAFFFTSTGIYYGRILWLGVSILIYWIGYGMLMRRELFVNEVISDLTDVSEESSKLSVKTEDHYQKLLQVIEEKELFRNPELNMSLLANEVGLSKGYLSQIINQKEGKNFFDFINAYRVEEVKQKMEDPKFSHYSILGIAFEAGFKSKSTFNSVFKKITGLTPSQYKKQP